MPSLKSLLALSCAVTLGSFPGFAVAAPCAVDAPIPPSEDPWYSEPKGFESSPPGSVLRVRPAPGNLTSVVGGTKSAWNVLYRTTDSRYKPTYAVTTVFVPKKPNKKALLSYQIPYDSAELDSSPSYGLYNISNVAGADAIPLVLSSAGWFVNVPDYEGPLASFTAGVMSGHATIDSVRAVRSLYKKFGFNEDAKYVMWGYSGGALASEWAAELQVQYAPEMNFAGAALGGLTPNVTSVLYSINGKASAGLGASAILGLGSQYPDVLKQYVSKLKKDGPYNATGFLAAKNMSLPEASENFAGKDLSKYFEDGFMDVLNNDTDKVIYNDGIMGYHGVPQMPLYVYKAVHDEISKIADTDDLVDKFCGIGANILYVRNRIGSHSEEGVLGALDAFSWLSSKLSGKKNDDYPSDGCKIETVSKNSTFSL